MINSNDECRLQNMFTHNAFAHFLFEAYHHGMKIFFDTWIQDNVFCLLSFLFSLASVSNVSGFL